MADTLNHRVQAFDLTGALMGWPGPHQETVLTPLALTAAERADLVAFLESLTDAPSPSR